MKKLYLLLLLFPLFTFGQVFLSHSQKKHQDIRSQSSFNSSNEILYNEDLRVILTDSTYHIELPENKYIEGRHLIEKTKYGDVYRFREGGNLSFSEQGIFANLYSRDEFNGMITFYVGKGSYEKEKSIDDSLWTQREYKRNSELWGTEVAECIKNKTPCIGMTKIQVFLAIGLPKKKSTYEMKSMLLESHRYDNITLDYKNGRLMSIHKF